MPPHLGFTFLIKIDLWCTLGQNFTYILLIYIRYLKCIQPLKYLVSNYISRYCYNLQKGTICKNFSRDSKIGNFIELANGFQGYSLSLVKSKTIELFL